MAATFTNIPDSSLAQDKPFTQSVARALRDNPLAINDGDATAPVMHNSAGAKGWVNFNGTGSVAIRQSYNVSSITDLGVGHYTANLTTPMADSAYIPVITANFNDTLGGNVYGCPRLLTTTAFNIVTIAGATTYDCVGVYAAIFGNLT